MGATIDLSRGSFLNSSSSPGIEFQRKRKNLNWVQLQAPTSLGTPIRALLGDVRWLLTTNGLCLRADDANRGPVYYVHPSADVDLGWMVKHRLRTRSQRAHSVTFIRNELEITQILNQASGVDELWLKRLSRIVRWTSPKRSMVRKIRKPRPLLSFVHFSFVEMSHRDHLNHVKTSMKRPLNGLRFKCRCPRKSSPSVCLV